MKWLIESNRWMHLIGIFLVGMFTYMAMGVLYNEIVWQTFFVVAYVSLAVSGAMEFKDVHHANGDKSLFEWDWDAWDWLDVLAGMIGYIVISAIVLLIH